MPLKVWYNISLHTMEGEEVTHSVFDEIHRKWECMAVNPGLTAWWPCIRFNNIFKVNV